MQLEELQGLLNSFLDRWPLEIVKEMKIEEYVGIGNKDTFCQWVETKTSELGSIRGNTSLKFEIYERKDKNKKLKNAKNDNKYTWRKIYGDDRNEVFNNVKNKIVKIIEFSEKGEFDKVEDININSLFKWKIAFLYSNERLIPIFKKKVLFKIAEHYGLQTNTKTKISAIQELMISKQPVDKDIYQYMEYLYSQFGREEKSAFNVNNEKYVVNNNKNRKIRKKANAKNLEVQERTISKPTYRATQKHNKIQEALKEKLIKEYGEENVLLEENFVDIKVIQPSYLGFYEVKSDSRACECIRKALGQVLHYVYCDSEKILKRIYVVGQYPPNREEEKYIDYIKANLKIDFEYISVEI